MEDKTINQLNDLLIKTNSYLSKTLFQIDPKTAQVHYFGSISGDISEMGSEGQVTEGHFIVLRRLDLILRTIRSQ